MFFGLSLWITFWGGVEMVGRASPKVKYFQRQLGDAERATLLAAGAGDISAGFQEVIDTYRHFYNLGLRPSTQIESVVLVIPQEQDLSGL
jgi:hypothetical protein